MTAPEPSIFSRIASAIGSVAPSLANALGGPLAGSITGLLTKTLGIGDSGDTDALLAALQSPESMLKLRTLELTHVIELKNIELLEQQASNADVKDARAAQNATESLTGKKNWLVAFLVVSAVLVFAFCLVAAYFSSGPVNQMFLFMIGQQSGVYMSVYAFYFSGIDPKKMFEDFKSQLNRGM